ncbi:MAG: FkbM family methyltransferase [Phycisphaerales bacterium]
MGLMRSLPRALSRFRVPPRGVIHVGAHEGQELPAYQRFGFVNQVWIEPQPDLFARLRARLPASPTIRAFHTACGEVPGEADMHVLANNDGLSNSLLEPRLHLEAHPQYPRGGTVRVKVVPLDDLLAREGLDPAAYSLLAVDVQGYELHVLRGAPRTLAAMDAVLCEVNTREMYAGCALLPQIDEHLANAGFTRVITDMSTRGYGDALYVRPAVVTTMQRIRQAVLGVPRR